MIFLTRMKIGLAGKKNADSIGVGSRRNSVDTAETSRTSAGGGAPRRNSVEDGGGKPSISSSARRNSLDNAKKKVSGGGGSGGSSVLANNTATADPTSTVAAGSKYKNGKLLYQTLNFLCL